MKINTISLLTLSTLVIGALYIPTMAGAKKTKQKAEKEIDQSRITITEVIGIDYLVTSPDGKKMGRDAKNQQLLNEVSEGSSYTEERGLENLDNPDQEPSTPYYVYSTPSPAKEGTYLVDIYSSEGSKYHFQVDTIGIGHNLKTFDFKGTLKPKQSDRFKIKFSKTKPPELIRPKSAK